MSHTSSITFFAPLRDGSRDAHLDEYLQLLEVRNGTLATDGTYPNREAWLTAINAHPVRYHGHIDSAEFERNFETFDPRGTTNRPLVTLLAFIKMNAGEAYGIEAVSKVRHRKPPLGSDRFDHLERIISKEERYHSRILAGATKQFGLPEPKSAYRPPLPLRALIGALMFAPKPAFHSVLLGAEVGGVFAVNWLLGRVREVFGDQPEIRDLMEERLIEILTDEIGHIAFNRLAISAQGMRIAEKLAPEVAHATAGITQEFKALGWSRNSLADFGRFGLSALPAQARKRAFFV
ncbi:MAG: hypothetical protein ACJ790_02895 [Myxococcaceae bacterium]